MASDPAPVAALLDEYLAFLAHHRGLGEATLYFHRRWVRQFLAHLASRLPDGDVRALTIAIIDDFTRPLARAVGRRTQSQLVQVVRGLLRHLHRTGRTGQDWSRCVQVPRRYRLATLPTTISLDEVRRLLAAVDQGSAVGRRNHAMLLLLAVYGLRAREVVDLRLEDVDWRARILRVRRSKTGRPLVLPLTAAVEQVIVSYLRHDRPQTGAREIFVRHVGTPVAFRKSSTVYALVRQAFDRAQVHATHRGPHVLRHALATHLVQRGFPLKTVGDLLGHHHPDSTLVYTKLAIEDLRDVALDVPEFES